MCGASHACAQGTARTPESAKNGRFLRVGNGPALAPGAPVIWFLEKHDDLLVCEIRRAEANAELYEFEIADAAGPRIMRFNSPKELIARYLDEHARLMADGWRPRAGNVTALE